MALPVIGQTFFDDTGSHDPTGTFRWIGLSSSADNWAIISRRWMEILNTPPGIYYWHTKSAHYGQLKDRHNRPINIAKHDRQAKEMRLCQLLGEASPWIVSIEISLDLAEHARIVKGNIAKGHPALGFNPVFARSLERPEYVALSHALAAIVSYMKFLAQQMKREGEEYPKLMWCVFEDSGAEWQDDICFSVQTLRKLMKQSESDYLGPVIFLPGKGRGGAIPLECADLFAWHVNRNAENAKNGKPPEPGWEHLNMIKRNPRVIDSAILQRMVEIFNRHDKEVSIEDLLP